MKTILIYSVIFLFHYSLMGQNIKTYSGDYLEKEQVDRNGVCTRKIEGKATYQYYENKEYERVYHGVFDFKSKYLSISGTYKNDLKDVVWEFCEVGLYYFYLGNSDYGKKKASGSFKDGYLTDKWIYEEIDPKTNKLLIKSTAYFTKNKRIGEYNFESHSISSYYGVCSLKCNFDTLGRLHGNFHAVYEYSNAKYEQIKEYTHGQLGFELIRSTSTGKVIYKFKDNIEEEEDAFYDEINYGVRPIEHALDFWICERENYDQNGCFNNIIYKTVKGLVLNINGHFPKINENENEANKLEEEKLITAQKENEEKILQKQRQEEVEKRRESAINEADSYYSKKNYTEALTGYYTALNLKYSDEIAAKISEAEKLVAEEKEKKKIEEEKAKQIALETERQQREEAIKRQAEEEKKRKFSSSDYGRLSQSIKTKFNQWLQKTEFETQKEYLKRIKNNAQEKFSEVISDEIKNSKRNSSQVLSGSIADYNIENETFNVNIFGEYSSKMRFSPISINIPSKIAPQIKQKFGAKEARQGEPLLIHVLEVSMLENNWIPSRILLIFPNGEGQNSSNYNQPYYDKSYWNKTHVIDNGNGKYTLSYAENINLKPVVLKNIDTQFNKSELSYNVFYYEWKNNLTENITINFTFENLGIVLPTE